MPPSEGHYNLYEPEYERKNKLKGFIILSTFITLTILAIWFIVDWVISRQAGM